MADHPYAPDDAEYAEYECCRAAFPELRVVHELQSEGGMREGWPGRLMAMGIGFPRRWYHKLFFMLGFVAMTIVMVMTPPFEAP